MIRLDVAVLGARESDRSRYLLAAYAALASGYRGYYLYTADPEDDLALSAAWDAVRAGSAASVRPGPLRMVFRHGLTRLLDIAWTVTSPDDPPVHCADSVHVVLDGVRLGEWLARPDQPGAALDMRLDAIDAYVGAAVAVRSAAGRVPPSVVVIAGAEAMTRGTGRRARAAAQQLAERLPDLLPCISDLATLLCLLDQDSAHRPLLFAIEHRLTGGLRPAEHRRIRTGRFPVDRELRTLRGGFGGQLDVPAPGRLPPWPAPAP